MGDKRGLAMSLLNLSKATEENEHATLYIREGLELFKELSDFAAVALALNNLGNRVQAMGDFLGASKYFEESLKMYRTLGGYRGIAMTLNNLGSVMYRLGHYEAANDLFSECYSIRDRLGDKRGQAFALLNLGNIAYDLGNIDESKMNLQSALRLFDEIKYLELGTYTRACLGRTMLNTNMALAEQILGEAGAECEGLESLEIASLVKFYLGHFYRAKGRFGEALALYLKSARSLWTLQERQYAPECLESLALAAVGLGSYKVAAALLGGAQSLRESTHMPLPPVEKQVISAGIDQCRTNLGTARFLKECYKGQKASFDNLLTLVTNQPLDSAPSLSGSKRQNDQQP
jgi:tetratricopeptide (TPR) repeat protein